MTLIATAFCLRAPFTCVGPLADVIQSDLGISSGAMGTITTIPLLMFAAFSVVMGDLGRRHPAGHVMVLGLAMVLSGVLCRSLLGTYGLFLGTAVVGIGITAGNVIIPAFIKAHYPERIGRLTGIYTAMMSLMSAVAGAVSVPIGDAVGWRGSLLVWAVLVAVVLLMWVPHRDTRIEEGVPEAGSRRSLLSSPTTWFIALYLGLQSLIYYAMVAWMAVILQSKGLDPSEAGVVVSVYMVWASPARSCCLRSPESAGTCAPSGRPSVRCTSSVWHCSCCRPGALHLSRPPSSCAASAEGPA